jgi:hypothetical protein
MIAGGRYTADKAKEFGFRHTHTMKGRCVMCGRERPKQKRKPEVLLMTLRKGWRLIAWPHSFRVQTLKIPSWGGNGNPVWTDVQRCPRTRYEWKDDELMCAVSMFHRRFREWEASLVPLPPDPAPPSLWQRFVQRWGV